MVEQYNDSQKVHVLSNNTTPDFDNPPQGPAGVHRGKRSVVARSMPFTIVILLAVVLGVFSWMTVSGNLPEVKFDFGWLKHQTSSQESAKSSSERNQDKKDADNKAATDNDSSSSSSSTNSEKSSQSDAQASNNSASSSGSSNSTDTSQTQTPAEPSQPTTLPLHKELGVRVVNGTNIAGYAGRTAQKLKTQGYASVAAVNAQGALPAQNVVWYKNPDALSTAQDVAKTLGIALVEQSNTISSPIVVVLVK